MYSPGIEPEPSNDNLINMSTVRMLSMDSILGLFLDKIGTQNLEIGWGFSQKTSEFSPRTVLGLRAEYVGECKDLYFSDLNFFLYLLTICLCWSYNSAD